MTMATLPNLRHINQYVLLHGCEHQTASDDTADCLCVVVVVRESSLIAWHIYECCRGF